MTKVSRTPKEHPWKKFVIKDEDLVMKLGDRLRVIANFDANDEEEGIFMHTEAAGQIYEAAGRKGAGWDLVKLSGKGPNEVRVLNGDVLTYFEILHQDGTISRAEPDDAEASPNGGRA